MHTLPDDDTALIDYHDARRVLAGIVRRAVQDYKLGIEPHAARAAWAAARE